MIKTFKQFILLSERFINLFPNDRDQRQEYVDEVWDILQASYAPIGGIKGSGFSTKEDMMSSALPMWKLVRKNDKIVAVAIYKDKKGRKFVAGGSDGSQEGKKGLIEILKSDLTQTRSYTELSGPIFHVLKKTLGSDSLKQFLLSRDEFAKVSGEDISVPSSTDSEVVRHPEFADFFYVRELGGHSHTKIALGTPGKKITKL